MRGGADELRDSNRTREGKFLIDLHLIPRELTVFSMTRGIEGNEPAVAESPDLSIEERPIGGDAGEDGDAERKHKTTD